MERVTKLVVLSQITFLVLVGLCVTILPHFLFERNEGGLSNYGVHASTAVFYTLAFVLSAVFQLRAAYALPQAGDCRLLRAVFMITAYSLLLVLVTTYPYQRSIVYGNIHMAANIWIFCFEMLAGGWIALVFRRSVISILLLLLQLLAFVLVVLTFLGTIHLLFIAQILTAVSFGLLLLMSTSKKQKRTTSQIVLP